MQLGRGAVVRLEVDRGALASRRDNSLVAALVETAGAGSSCGETCACSCTGDCCPAPAPAPPPQ